MVEAVKLHKQNLPLPPQFAVADGKVVRVANAGKENVEAPGEDSVEGISQGMRCLVQPGSRRGEVAYVGLAEDLSGGGYWVGVRFDEPVGKMNGRVKATVYFEAEENCGGMVRGKNVEVGDFPVEELDLEDSSDEEEEEEL